MSFASKAPFVAVCVASLALASPALAQQARAPAPRPPAELIGHAVGADFKLASWSQIVAYMTELGARSERVRTRELGRSTEGRPFLVVEITSAANQQKRESIRRASKRIADPRRIEGAADEAALRRDAKVVIGLACSLHSIEVAASQMSLELAYWLASSDDPRVEEILDKCVILLFPSQNPDGNDKVRDWYLESLGKPWEGGRMPWLYQKYAGHDNNRDWFMLNLLETRHVTRVLYEEWAPTIYYDIHQMGNRNARFFVPPFHDPINPNLDPLVNQWLMIIGGHMSAELLSEGRTGIVTGAMYDNWWAGGNRTTPQRHNIVALLTEAASANIASPVFQRKRELGGASRGMPDYRPAVNFPAPWPGGWWRLRDIVDYELSACRSLMTLGARYHDRLIDGQIALGRKQLAAGRAGSPAAWLLPAEQRDPGSAGQLLELLALTGIEIDEATEPFVADGVEHPAGTRILRAEQPFRPHLKDMMERQRYPSRYKYPGGPAESPYDMAGWTLPLQMGVKSLAVDRPFEAKTRRLERPGRARGLVTVSDAGVESPLEGRELRPGWWLCRNRTNDAFALLAALWRRGVTPRVSRVAFERGALRFAPGTLAFELPLGEAGAALVAELETLAERRRVELVPSEAPPTGPADRLESVRIGLYQPWTASMDEGWTRLVLERFELPYVSLHNADIRAGAEQLRARVDVVLLPSMRSSRMLDGVARDATAPRYAGGLGVEGVAALQGFAEQGGVLVANDASCDLLIKHLRLPVKNVLRADEAKDFYCAGSILRATVDVRHPLGYGMPERCAAFFTRSQAFEVEEQAWPRPVAAAKKKNVEPAALPPGMRPERARRYPSVAPVRYAESLLLESGWIQQPEHIEGKPAIVESRYGRGRVILLGFRVQHRAQPHGTFRLLFNALVRGGLRPLDE